MDAYEFYRINTIQDLFIAPFYLILFTIVAFLIRKKYTKGQQHIKSYFIPALYCRFFGATVSYLLYAFHNGGDTMGYFNYAKAFNHVLLNDFDIAIEILFGDSMDQSYKLAHLFSDYHVSYIGKGYDTAMVGRIGSLLSLFTFKSYLGISYILAFFSFLGSWKLFEVFNQEYPRFYKSIAWATLFVPSVFFWGSAGLMKDTIIIIALGYTVHGLYTFFILRRKRLIGLISFIIGFYFISVIKVYITIVLIPAVAIWVFLKKASSIRNKQLKRVAFPIILMVGLSFSVGLIVVLSNFSNNSKYNLNKILYTAEQTQWWHKVVSENSGSSYDLGKWNPTFLGLLPMIPKSINVTLFRPYPWEARKVILIPAAIESLLAIFLTIFVLLRIGIIRFFKTIFSDATLIFCLTFSLTFAFAVGFTSYNFGALARYKIPCLPFYFVALAILYNSKKKKRRILNK